MVAEPELTPVTTPLAEPIVATDVVLLLHTPPDVAFESVVDVDPEPPHNVAELPDIDPGCVLTVTTLVEVAQPLFRL